jgi:type IV pilus assembly protein PilV
MHFRLQRGANLIEVLIAIVVVTLGMLGLAKMQMGGMRYTQQSQFRSEATILAREIIDRMRTNGGQYTQYLHTLGKSISEKEGNTDICGANRFCLNSQIPVFDKYVWLSDIAAVLPNGQGEVSCSGSGNARLCTAGVYWSVVTPVGVPVSNPCNVSSDLAKTAGDNAYFDCVRIQFRLQTAT